MAAAQPNRSRNALLLAVAVSTLLAWDAHADDDDDVAQSRVEQAFNVTFGAGFVTDYIDGGESLSGGDPSFNAFIEPSYGIFYTGIGLATVKLAPDDDDDEEEEEPAGPLAVGEMSDFEARFYAGIRPRLGPVNFDIGLEHKTYGRLRGIDETSAHIEAEFEPVERLELEMEAEYAFEEREWEVEAGLGFELTEKLKLFASGGYEFGERVSFWRAGAEYSFTDSLSANVAYVGADDSLSKIVAGLAFQTSLAQLRGSPVDDD